MTTHLQMCRICHNGCPIVVDVEDGRAVRVRGDRDNPVYDGYLCPKGRTLPELHNDPARLLHPLKRTAHGDFEPIPMTQAIDEIAARLQDIIDAHGPRSLMAYGATGVQPQVVMFTAMTSFLDALGSPWPPFSASSIDQAGKATAAALHGTWMAPPQSFDEPDVGLLVGINPLVSHMGFPQRSPITWLRERKAAGMQLLVVDPRRSETAHHADIHLQPRPGEDIAVLAGLLHVILEEGWHDQAFVAAHADGIDALRAAVAPYSPAAVAARADVPADDLVAVARTYGQARRGFVSGGTAVNMSGTATLAEYLILCLGTICGRWQRAGEVVRAAPALMRRREYRAQVSPPRPTDVPGPPLRVPGRTRAPGGLQIGDMVDEMLLPGEGRVRALICAGGNPVAAWPDQLHTIRGLEALDLLVVVDPSMTATARLADYVVPPKLLLEVPSSTLMQDYFGGRSGFGYVESHAQYVPPAVDPPAGADVIEEWELLYEIATRMGRRMRIGRVELDPASRPTSDEVLALLVRNARVPLDEVKQHPHGALFVDESITVLPSQDGWTGRFDLAAAPMLADLADLAATIDAGDGDSGGDDAEFPLRLTARRMLHVQNSMLRGYVSTRPRHNPAFMNAADMAGLGVVDGDRIEIRSSRAAIIGVATRDDGLRPGVVSMAHGFGDLPAVDAADQSLGANTGRLVDIDVGHDPYSGQPRMSNIPIAVRRLGVGPIG